MEIADAHTQRKGVLSASSTDIPQITPDPTELPPVAFADLMAAALDGGDLAAIAALVLAHPFSVWMPRDFLADLWLVSKNAIPVGALLETKVISAGNLLLKREVRHG